MADEIKIKIPKINLKKIKKNPWVLTTIVLGVLVIIALLNNGFALGISANKASQNLLEYYQNNGVEGLSIESVEKISGLYQVNFEYQGNTVPMYVTKDGKYIAASLSPLIISDSEPKDTEQQNIPKSDKPKVELFIWGYCPYGVQAQGPLAEVASLLRDYADFKAVLYYDGHGAFETQQNKIQECIQEIAPEKYWDYAAKFVTDIYPKCGTSKDVDCDKTESVKLMKSLGIDSTKILSCVDEKGDDLLSTASSRAKSLGVTGSPTLVINGVKANPSSRTADAFKSSICTAFNTPPEACGEQLSAAENTASGSC